MDIELLSKSNIRNAYGITVSILTNLFVLYIESAELMTISRLNN